jgi:hypothetical protein
MFRFAFGLSLVVWLTMFFSHRGSRVAVAWGANGES